MKAGSCPYEMQISYAARTGRWDDSTRAHVEHCAYCREIVAVVEWMREIADKEIRGSVVPDPALILLNARIATIQAGRESALHPLTIAAAVVRSAVISMLALGLLWVWLEMRSLAAVRLTDFVPFAQPMLISAAALTVCLLALLLVRLIQPVLLED